MALLSFPLLPIPAPPKFVHERKRGNVPELGRQGHFAFFRFLFLVPGSFFFFCVQDVRASTIGALAKNKNDLQL